MNVKTWRRIILSGSFLLIFLITLLFGAFVWNFTPLPFFKPAWEADFPSGSRYGMTRRFMHERNLAGKSVEQVKEMLSLSQLAEVQETRVPSTNIRGLFFPTRTMFGELRTVIITFENEKLESVSVFEGSSDLLAM